jgi:hypothetical protein
MHRFSNRNKNKRPDLEWAHRNVPFSALPPSIMWGCHRRRQQQWSKPSPWGLWCLHYALASLHNMRDIALLLKGFHSQEFCYSSTNRLRHCQCVELVEKSSESACSRHPLPGWLLTPGQALCPPITLPIQSRHEFEKTKQNKTKAGRIFWKTRCIY